MLGCVAHAESVPTRRDVRQSRPTPPWVLHCGLGQVQPAIFAGPMHTGAAIHTRMPHAHHILQGSLLGK